MNIYELTPRHDSRASFHGKARIIEHPDGTKQLQSYNTIVCEISPRGVFKMLWDGKTQTTTRHIKEFRKQFERAPDEIPETLEDLRDALETLENCYDDRASDEEIARQDEAIENLKKQIKEREDAQTLPDFTSPEAFFCEMD